MKTDSKSNEITAISELLDLLFLEKSVITIDAMGTQKDIAEKIMKKKGDYVPALKCNQGLSHKEVIDIWKIGLRIILNNNIKKPQHFEMLRFYF